MDKALELVTVFGGSGFVGTQTVQALARRGLRVRVAVRRPDLAGHVRPLGAVGQVVPVQANLRNADSISRAIAGADLVVNLVGIGNERANQRFTVIHVEGAARIAEASRRGGVQRLVHMSAMGAAADSPSTYAVSKAQGEAAVLAAFPEAIIIRPSAIFGPGDGFFNLFGAMARLLPVLPLIGGDTKMQPVFIGDVAEAFALAALGAVRGGRAYELGGPQVLTVRAIMEKVLKETGRTNPLLPVPVGIAKLLALPVELLPRPFVTRDRVTLLTIDNVVSPEAERENRTLAAFDLAPGVAMDSVLPDYLWRFRKNGQFDRVPA